MKGLLRRPDFLAFAFLLLLVLLFLWQGTLAGKALLPADALFSFLPWRPYATQVGVGIPHNELIADMVLQNFGWKELIRSSLLQGQLPFWNPYVFTGMPLLATGQGAALYPPAALLFTLLPIAQAYVWFTALHLLMGGLFTYFYLRVISAGRWGALLAATAFSLSGFLVVSFQWPQMVGAAIWLPFLLACLEQVFRRAERHPPATRQEAWGQWLGMPFWTIAGALGMGLQFLAGHLEISFYILFMLLAYAVVRLGLMTREQGLSWDVAKGAGAAGLMMGLGAALAGAQLAPFFELVQQNFRAGSATFQQVTGLGLPARQLIAFFIPDFFGNPTHHSYFDVVRGQVLAITGATDLAGQPRSYPFWGVKDYVEGTAYAGLLPLMLAGAALLLRRDRYTAFFAGYGIFALLLAFGTPLYALLFFGVPGYDQLHSPFRWVYPYSFCVVVLAGLGADTLLRDIQHSGGPVTLIWLRRWLGPSVAATGVLALLVLLASRIALPASLDIAGSLIARSPALAAAFSSPEMLYSYQFRNFAVFGGLLLLSGVALTVALRRRGVLGPALLLGVLTVDLVSFGWGVIAFTDARLMTFTPPALRWLQQEQPDGQPFRVTTYGPGDLLPPNSGMLAGIQDIRGYDSIIPRQYVELWRLLEEPTALRYNRLMGLTQPAALASPLLDLMNVKYVLTDQPLDQEGFTRVYEGEVFIYRNDDALPRAFAVFEAQPAADQAQARQLVADPGFDPRRTVVLETDLPTGQAGTAPGRSGAATARMQAAEVLRYEPNRVVARVRMPQEGYLVLSDAYFPGWRARDGQGRDLPIQRADANFRAVLLGPGDHTVTFTYFPDSFKLGLYVSFLGAVVCLLTAGYWGWRRFYREAAETSAVRRVAKNSLTPMTAQVLARTVDFGFAIFMLRLLGPASYGSYAFAVALIGYFAILTDYGLGTLLTREVARDPSQASRYASNSIAIRLALCVASAPLLVAVAWLYHWRFGLPVEAVIAAGLFMVSLVPSSVAGALSAVFSAHEKMEYQALVNVATTVLRAALGIAVLLLGWGIIGLGAVSVATSTATALVFFFLVTRTFFRPSMAVDPTFGKGLIRTATPLMLNNLLNSVFFRIDMMLIQPMRGTEAVGFYSTAYKFIEGLLMIPAFFTLALFPVLSRYAETSRELLMRAYTRALKVLILVALPITVAVTVTAEQLILLLFGEAYAPAVRALQILIWFLPFSYVNGVTQYVLIAVNQQRYLTGAFLLGTSFNLIANLLVIPAYGIEGAAVVTILSEMALMAPFMRGIYRYVGPLPLGSLGLSAVAAAGAMGAFLLLLRQYPFWITVPLGAGLYLGALFMLRVFDEEDRAILRSLLAR